MKTKIEYTLRFQLSAEHGIYLDDSVVSAIANRIYNEIEPDIEKLREEARLADKKADRLTEIIYNAYLDSISGDNA